MHETQDEKALTLASSGQQAISRASDWMPVFDISTAVARRTAMVEFVKQILIEGTDFGKVPGSERPCLLKPGAEKLSTFFGLVPEFELESYLEAWDGMNSGGEPLFYYRYKCRLLKNGRSIGEGVGSCNSWESKYRYRWVQESQLPEGSDKTKLQARGGTIWEPGFAIEKGETTGKYGKPPEYWQRFRDAIANNTARAETRESKSNGKKIYGHVIDSTMYRLPNPDVADQVNTLQKMAQKRAHIAAVLCGVNASEYFTQDLDDRGDNHAETTEQVAERRIEEEKQKANGNGGHNGQPGPQSVPAQSKPAAPVATEIPPAVQAIWARMVSIKGVCEQLAELKASLVEVMGKEQGEWTYYQKLERHGAKHANDFKSTKPARLCAHDLYDAIQNEVSLKKPSGFQAGNSDLPDALWPDEKPAHTSPYSEGAA